MRWRGRRRTRSVVCSILKSLRYGPTQHLATGADFAVALCCRPPVLTWDSSRCNGEEQQARLQLACNAYLYGAQACVQGARRHQRENNALRGRGCMFTAAQASHVYAMLLACKDVDMLRACHLRMHCGLDTSEQHSCCRVQAKLAKLRRELLEPSSGSGGGGKGEGASASLGSTTCFSLDSASSESCLALAAWMKDMQPPIPARVKPYAIIMMQPAGPLQYQLTWSRLQKLLLQALMSTKWGMQEWG